MPPAVHHPDAPVFAWRAGRVLLLSALLATMVSSDGLTWAQDGGEGWEPQPANPPLLQDRRSSDWDPLRPEGSGSQALPETRERQLENEQRLLDGRIQTLDRQLAPYDRDRLRASPPDPFTGQRRSRRDPIAERHSLERRNLESQQRMIERDLDRGRYDRSGGPSSRPSFGRDR